jgi:hypothetical protein
MKDNVQMTRAAEDVTRLSLLTRDGAIAVQFSPSLDTQHYSELFEMASDFDSEFELRSIVQKAAERWNRNVCFG